MSIQKKLMEFLASPTADEPLEYIKQEDEDEPVKLDSPKRMMSVIGSEQVKISKKPVDGKDTVNQTPREGTNPIETTDVGSPKKTSDSPMSPTKLGLNSQRIKIGTTDRKTTDRTENLPTDATRGLKLAPKRAS